MLFIYSPLTIRAYLHSPVSRFRAVHGVMVTSTYFIKNKNCLRRTYIPFYCGLTRCSATVRHCRAFRISMVTFTYLFKTKNVYRRQYSLLLRLNATFRNCSALPRPSHLHGNFYISFKNKKPLPLTYILFYYSLTYWFRQYRVDNLKYSYVLSRTKTRLFLKRSNTIYWAVKYSSVFSAPPKYSPKLFSVPRR